jgi:hypothetical protein
MDLLRSALLRWVHSSLKCTQSQLLSFRLNRVLI